MKAGVEERKKGKRAKERGNCREKNVSIKGKLKLLSAAEKYAMVFFTTQPFKNDYTHGVCAISTSSFTFIFAAFNSSSIFFSRGI